MLPLRISNATRVLAQARPGYHVLAIRDAPVDVAIEGGVQQANGMTSLWEPTPAELKMLNAGGSIQLTILGTVHPPVLMAVQPAPK